MSDCYLPRLGGIETQVHDLAEQQLAQGHDVEVVTAVALADAAPDDITTHRPPGRSRTGSTTRLSARRRGVRQALTGGYDVLHLHLSMFSPLALSVLLEAGRAGMPIAATMHSLWGNFESALAASAPIMRWHARPVAWSAVSSAAALPLQRRLGLPVSIVPNGVDVGWWARAADRSAGSQLRVLSVMRLCQRKRPLPLLRLVAEADRLSRRNGGAPLRLTIVGDGPQRAEVHHRAAQCGLEVDITGALSRSQIRSLASEHDVYAAPAPLESFGIAALKARSAGLPVIGRRSGGIGDFIRDGQDGALVDSDREMTDVLSRLAAEPAELARLQRMAGTAPPLGWDRTLGGYDDLYDQALDLAAGTLLRQR